MNAEELAKTLHPLEVRVLEHLGDALEFTDRAFEAEGVTEANLRTVIEWQLAKSCMTLVASEERVNVELTEAGEQYVSGTPEGRLVERLRETGGAPLRELAGLIGLSQEEVGSAFGALRKAGVLTQVGEMVELVPEADLSGVETQARLIARISEAGRLPFESLAPAEAEIVHSGSRKRSKGKGIFRLQTETSRRLRLTELGREVQRAIRRLGRSGDEVNQLTPEMLADGSFRGKRFRRYNLGIRPERKVAGRRNPYREFLDFVRRKMIALGFEEMRGSLVEPEFWNNDALFMPQFHAARDIHDAYFVKAPTQAQTLDEPFASQVAAAHSNGAGTGSRGWGYEFDRERSRRLVLRSQGTVLSARWLHRAKVPGKYFAIARCFRYDEVDATHAPDFFQCEGIVLGREIGLVSLLGLLKLFATEIAQAEEVRFSPDYFPFTEPSVGVHIKHKTLGWTELGGAGIFRPEVTRPQGVDVPVIAWGLGLDRMAMVAMGIDDIRELFSTDLAKVRSVRIRMKG